MRKIEEKNKIEDKYKFQKVKEDIVMQEKIPSQNIYGVKKEKDSAITSNPPFSKIHNSNSLGMSGKLQYEIKYYWIRNQNYSIPKVATVNPKSNYLGTK